MLAQDGAGRLSAGLPHPAGPQAAFPRNPRGGSVTVPAAGKHTIAHLFHAHAQKKLFMLSVEQYLPVFALIIVYLMMFPYD